MLAIPLPLLAKTNVPKLNPTHHDASFSTIARGLVPLAQRVTTF
jgi:hypothetical protein